MPINSLLDDFYVFDEESYKLTGEHTGRIFTLGQKAEIVVRSADKMERTIDFILKEFSQYGEYPDPDDYYGDGMPSRKTENIQRTRKNPNLTKQERVFLIKTVFF